MRKVWGKWTYDAKRLVLVYQDKRKNAKHWDWYEVDLEECCTASEVLDWVAQLSAKTWASREDIGYLVQALDELLKLQSNIVHLSGGRRFDVEAHLTKGVKRG